MATYFQREPLHNELLHSYGAEYLFYFNEDRT